MQILKYLGKKLDGYKTKIGGGGSILMGILGIIGIMFPDQKTIDISLEASLSLIAGGFVALGVGGKLEKLKTIIDENKEESTRSDR
jgi:hypothetical protein